MNLVAQSREVLRQAERPVNIPATRFLRRLQCCRPLPSAGFFTFVDFLPTANQSYNDAPLRDSLSKLNKVLWLRLSSAEVVPMLLRHHCSVIRALASS